MIAGSWHWLFVSGQMEPRPSWQTGWRGHKPGLFEHPRTLFPCQCPQLAQVMPTAHPNHGNMITSQTIPVKSVEPLSLCLAGKGWGGNPEDRKLSLLITLLLPYPCIPACSLTASRSHNQGGSGKRLVSNTFRLISWLCHICLTFLGRFPLLGPRKVKEGEAGPKWGFRWTNLPPVLPTQGNCLRIDVEVGTS